MQSCVIFYLVYMSCIDRTRIHTSLYQKIYRVRTRLLTEVVFSVGLETFSAVVENTEVDKLCLLVKDLKQLL
jgi:hypothetical protein